MLCQDGYVDIIILYYFLLQSMTTATGTHILGNLTDCDQKYLSGLNMEDIRGKISKIIKNNGITELGSYYHRFDNNSFTGVISLAESHISVHTWPELKTVTIDVYVCNYQSDNTEAARKIFAEISELFGKSKISKQEIER